MPKVAHVPFGSSPADAVVKAFLERKGINPRDVSGYVISRNARGVSAISVTMLFDEEPVAPESDKGE
jgi:hypothetical protein